MRTLITSSVLFATLASAPLFAAETLPLEKIKTGILPAGGFYGVYEVTCRDQTAANVVSTERGGRWCTSFDGQLSCFNRSQDASRRACSNDTVVSREKALDDLNAYQ